MGHFNAYICQAAKDARASQDILIDIFERIEMFFRRLEIYTELPSTMEMMDTIIQVMAEGSLNSWDRDEGDQAGPNE